MIVAEPLEKNNKTYCCIFILNASTMEEAKQLLAADPTIKQNIFEMEYYNWHGSATLPEHLKSADKI